MSFELKPLEQEGGQETDILNRIANNTVANQQQARDISTLVESAQSISSDTSGIKTASQNLDADIGATTDAPNDTIEDTTARTGITLWKSIKNILGITTGDKVITDANGTIQQYLRGLVYLIISKITVVIDNATLAVTQSGTWTVTKEYIRETVVASARRSTSGDSGMLSGDYGPYAEIVAMLLVTAHVGATGTLDVKIQHSVDAGTTWDDLVSFAQVTTTDGPVYVNASRWDFTGPRFFGNKLKVVWTLGGVNPDYTFNVDWCVKA